MIIITLQVRSPPGDIRRTRRGVPGREGAHETVEPPSHQRELGQAARRSGRKRQEFPKNPHAWDGKSSLGPFLACL